MNSLNRTENQDDLQAPENHNPETGIPILEERLQVDIHQVETGKVQLHKKVISEEVSQQIEIVHEEVDIQHVPINEYVNTPPVMRYEGDTTIIPVVKEVLVVEKRLMLVEELHITKKQVLQPQIITETVRREEIEVSRIDLTQNKTTNQ